MYTRTSPYFARIKERFLLTGPGSTKKTYHIALDVANANLSCKVGDSIGILPENSPDEVNGFLEEMQAKGDEIVHDARAKVSLSLKEFLSKRANLAKANSPLLRAILEKKGEDPAIEELLLPENRARLNAHLHTHTPLELLQLHKAPPFLPEELPALLLPLLPRFYSIANSLKMFPHEIHLTVADVDYEQNGKRRRGVGSYFLAELAIETTPIPIYVQPSHSFTLPADSSSSIILVGPGTGIAPYRAFLQERLATQAEGRNWLFFGERNRKTDFYYETFWTDLEKQGRLRLSLAFSRDSTAKTYVQHRMFEERRSLWNWIENGAYFYVCGDAEEMAKDVDAMLHNIVGEESGLNETETRAFVKKLRLEKRYLTDVY